MADHHHLEDEKLKNPIVEGQKTVIDQKKVNLSSVIHVDFDETEEKDVLKEVEDELGKIVKSYEEKEHHEKIQKAEDTYNRLDEVKDYPMEGASNRKLALTAEMVDQTVRSGIRQSWGVRPAVLLEHKKERISRKDIENRQDLLDHTLRHRDQADLETLDKQNYKYACLHGGAIVHIPYCHDIEYYLHNVTYKPDDISPDRKPTNFKFENKHKADLHNKKSKWFKEWEKLRNGETITVEEDDEMLIFHGAKPYRVDPFKFWARLDIADFRKHRVISEERNFVWDDIEKRMNAGFYKEEYVDKLTENENNNHLTKDFCIHESIINYKRKGDDKTRRYKITFDTDKRVILRWIYYPYDHNKPDYVIYRAFPRDKSWWGDSYFEKMKDVEEMAKIFINSIIDEYSLAHRQTILTDDNEFEAERRTIQDDSGINVMMFRKGTRFQQMAFDYASPDRLGILNWLVNRGETQMGISVSLMSGGQTPDDPRAPLGKARLKQAANYLSIEGIVHNLQEGDEAVAEQVEKINYQYPDPEFADSDEYVYYKGGEKRTLKREIYSRDVRYVMHGSRLSFDRELDRNSGIETTAFLRDFYPETLWLDPEVKYTMARIVIVNTEGSVEKNQEKILAPLKAQAEKREMIKSLIEEFREKGWDDDRIQQALSQILASQGGQGASGPGAGKPVQGQAPPGQSQLPPGGKLSGNVPPTFSPPGAQR